MMKLIAFIAVVGVAFGAFSGDPKSAEVLHQDSDILPDGSYKYSYETENGISGQESGVPKPIGTESPVVVEGSFQYVGDDGKSVDISYTADENGYQPQGDILPKAPPIPAIIARSLEYIAAHPQPEKL